MKINWQEAFSRDEAQIIANKQLGKVYVADFRNGEGKYVSSTVKGDEPYDVELKISPRIDVRITYLIKDKKIKGVQITKVHGKKSEKVHLSTLEFDGMLNILGIFTNLDMDAIAQGGIVLDSSIVQDPDALRKHLSTIIADPRGLETLKTMADSAEIIKEISAAQKKAQYKEALQSLKDLLALEESGRLMDEVKTNPIYDEYKAGQPEKVFQKWIEKNLWVFGVEYKKIIPRTRIAISSQADCILQSMDGFMDLIEYKRPKLERGIFRYDDSHKSYYPTNDTSAVIGQCLLYLQKMEESKLQLEKEYDTGVLRPRIKIILGRSVNFSKDEIGALRMLNASLHDINIITYDHIVSCAEKIIENL